MCFFLLVEVMPASDARDMFQATWPVGFARSHKHQSCFLADEALAEQHDFVLRAHADVCFDFHYQPLRKDGLLSSRR